MTDLNADLLPWLNAAARLQLPFVALLLLAAWLLAAQSWLGAFGSPQLGDAAASPGLAERAWVFDVLVVATLAAGRWLSILDPVALNPDEAQMLAQASRFQLDPMPWRSVDGTSGGPFNSYALLPAIWLGFAGYQAARLTALGLLAALLCLTHRTLRLWWGDGPARLAVLAPLAFLSLASHDVFHHYASELLAIALLAGAVYALTLSDRNSSLGWASFAGLLLGAVPFAKMQGAPLALASGAVGLASCVRRRPAESPSSGQNQQGSRRWTVDRRRLGGLAGGAFAVPALVLGVLAWAGAFKDFWWSYFEWSMLYTKAIDLPWVETGKLFVRTSEQRAFLIHAAVLAGTALVLLAVERGRRGGGLPFLALLLGYLVLAVLTVRAPHRPIVHYVFFTLHPLSLLMGGLLAAAMAGAGESRSSFRRPALALLLASLAGLAVQLSQATSRTQLEVHTARITLHHQGQRAIPAAILDRLTHAGEKVAVWGWAPSLYVESGTVPATRDAITYNQIADGPRLDYFRRRYLADLLASSPPLVVDAVHPGNFAQRDPERQGLRSFPELWAIVQRDYVELGAWLGAPAEGMAGGQPTPRFYIARGRVEAIASGELGPAEQVRGNLLELASSRTQSPLLSRW